MSGSSRRIRVASYNIHSCIGIDRRYRPERVVEVIGEIGPDVIGLQEVDTGYRFTHAVRQVSELVNGTGMWATVGPTLEATEGYYGNVILSRWPVVETRRVDLTIPGREPRGGLRVTLDIHGSGLRFVVTHLGLRARERILQVRKVLEDMVEPLTGPTVVAGDMNEWLGNRRALRAMDARLGSSVALRTFPALFPLLALDRIWVSPPHHLDRVWVHRSPEARRASDHLPLVAQLSLTGGAP